ncbi:hypothetical protein NIES4102_03780 [Chondrocystis sp. NIES-4102]|nr:hypothetical protein NIES4102_03780 [Chondrocystis sp. NIES-4102]
METVNKSSGFEVTQLTAINVAKFITILCLITLALIYGIKDERQVIYLCLHISYCLWWLLEQYLFPLRRQQLFTEKVGISTLIVVVLFVGVFYCLPGYLAFTNPNPISYLTIAIALPLYIFGSLINTGADVQKMVAKSMGSGLVQDGIWRGVRHINYLGDLMRYSSFSVVAGNLWAFLLPGIIILLYLQRISQKEEAMSNKYSEFAAYQQNSSRLLPWIW